MSKRASPPRRAPRGLGRIATFRLSQKIFRPQFLRIFARYFRITTSCARRPGLSSPSYERTVHMHTATNQRSETANTNTQTAEEVLA